MINKYLYKRSLSLESCPFLDELPEPESPKFYYIFYKKKSHIK